MSKEQAAIYYPDGSSQTRSQVRRRLLAEELTQPLHRTDRPSNRTFTEWQSIMARRSKEFQELLAIPELVEIEIATEGPILIGLFGDVHAAHPECDLERFGQDIEAVKAAGGYFLTLGDLTDSIHWGPVPGLTSDEEAMLYMQSALAYMAEGGALLAGWTGDHDMWAFDKHGGHTLYQSFWERYNAHLLDGVSYIDLALNDGTNIQRYAIIGSHRHKGHSVYNDAHGAWRQQLDEANTSRQIVSVTAHNHTKAYLQQTRKCFGGDERLIHSITLGTYKRSDRYSRKMGWPRKGEETAGSPGIVLWPDQDRVKYFWNLDEAVEFLSMV